jgi:hypothetical protein
MIVSVRDVVAKCPGCGETQFTPLAPGALQPATRMKCDGCGAQTTYRELLEQIGEEAMRRANESLAALKKKAPPRRKPRK